jgi:hypothetical protein
MSLAIEPIIRKSITKQASAGTNRSETGEIGLHLDQRRENLSEQDSQRIGLCLAGFSNDLSWIDPILKNRIEAYRRICPRNEEKSSILLCTFVPLSPRAHWSD